MAATQNEINTYLYNTRCAFADYGANVSKYQKIGCEDIKCYKLKLELLDYYIEVIVDYFDSSDYANINFFTTDEARDIMQHINNLSGTYYMLDL